jgi:hypothetical protein
MLRGITPAGVMTAPGLAGRLGSVRVSGTATAAARWPEAEPDPGPADVITVGAFGLPEREHEGTT